MKFNKHGIAKTFKFESLLDRALHTMEHGLVIVNHDQHRDIFNALHHGYVGRPTPEVITQMEWSRNNSRF